MVMLMRHSLECKAGRGENVPQNQCIYYQPQWEPVRVLMSDRHMYVCMVVSTKDASFLGIRHVNAAFGLQAEFPPSSAVGGTL